MKYIVWIKIHDPRNVDYTHGEWEPNGDGPMGPKIAERVAREIANNSVRTKVLPEGARP